MDKLALLSQINLFEELAQDELMSIDHMSEMSVVKKGTTIISPEDHPMNALFLLKKGQVRLYRINEEGKQFTLDILVGGNIFGETSTISLTDDQTFAEAMTDSYICTINHSHYEQLITQNPHIALKLIDLLSSKLNDFYTLSEKIALSDVKHRLLYLLLMLSQKTGRRKQNWQTIEMKLTHQDLGNMIGATRETTSAMMSKLKKEGYIRKIRFLAINAEKTEALLKLS